LTVNESYRALSVYQEAQYTKIDKFCPKMQLVSKTFCTFADNINNIIMSNSRTITIKNPSRKLEEKIREAGVQKYLWLKELCSEENKPNKVIYV
jgi:hypothetical protein